MKKSPEKTDSSQNHQPEQSRKDNKIYSADSPIINPELDEFNRRLFSERIARTIANRKDTKSLVIGIYGKWGRGKPQY
jgi:predicted KAP-like P-loop ATPase